MADGVHLFSQLALIRDVVEATRPPAEVDENRIERYPSPSEAIIDSQSVKSA